MLSSIASQIEAILFLSQDPVSERELREVLGVSPHELKLALEELRMNLESENHGIILKAIAGGFVLETSPEICELLSRFRASDSSKKRKANLTKAAIETAAIIAYNQPVTRGEIDEIRGVRSDGIVARLLENGVIKISGRKKRGNASPLTFSTTRKFLEIFGLNELSDLPELDELE